MSSRIRRNRGTRIALINEFHKLEKNKQKKFGLRFFVKFVLKQF